MHSLDWICEKFCGNLVLCSSHSIGIIFCSRRYVDELLYWSGRRMFLDEYLQGELSPNRLPPTWVSRTKFVFQSDDGGLAVYETTNNSVKSLVTNHTLVSVVSVCSHYKAMWSHILKCSFQWKPNVILLYFLFLSLVVTFVPYSGSLTLRDISVQLIWNLFCSNTT